MTHWGTILDKKGNLFLHICLVPIPRDMSGCFQHLRFQWSKSLEICWLTLDYLFEFTFPFQYLRNNVLPHVLLLQHPSLTIKVIYLDEEMCTFKHNWVNFIVPSMTLNFARRTSHFWSLLYFCRSVNRQPTLHNKYRRLKKRKSTFVE